MTLTPVTTVTSYSEKVHPSKHDAELWAAIFYDATGEIPRAPGYTVRKYPDGNITLTEVT